MEFLYSLLMHHFAGRPAEVSQNVGSFLRLEMSQILISNCIYGGTLDCKQQLGYILTYTVARRASPSPGWYIST